MIFNIFNNKTVHYVDFNNRFLFFNCLYKILREEFGERNTFGMRRSCLDTSTMNFIIPRVRDIGIKDLLNYGFSSDCESRGVIQIYPHTLQIIRRWTFGSFSHTGRRLPRAISVERSR